MSKLEQRVRFENHPSGTQGFELRWAKVLSRNPVDNRPLLLEILENDSKVVFEAQDSEFGVTNLWLYDPDLVEEPK
jgi:hypothetical protein